MKVTDIKKPPEPAKKSALRKVKDALAPPKTEEKLREEYMIKKWSLKKDAVIPHRYWLSDHMFITFIPGDEVSVAKAEQTLAEYYRAPQIESAPRDIAAKSPYASGKKGSSSSKGGLVGALSEVSTEVEPIARNAAKASEQALAVDGLGFDPVKAQDRLFSMRGVPSHKGVGYKDFMGDDPLPKSTSTKSTRTKQKRKGDDFL